MEYFLKIEKIPPAPPPPHSIFHILFTDYLIHPANLNFNFSLTPDNEILTIINQYKNNNSSGVDEISKKQLNMELKNL